ncbi:cation:proton antiporter, partial [Spirochaetota bacterium]
MPGLRSKFVRIIPKIGLLVSILFILIILNDEVAKFLLKVFGIVFTSSNEILTLFLITVPSQNWWWHLPLVGLVLLVTKIVGGIIADKIKFPLGIVAFCVGIIMGIIGELFSINFVVQIHKFNFNSSVFSSWLVHMGDMVAGLILLGIGLETSPKQFLSVGKTSFKMAIVGMAIPFILTFVVVFPYLYFGNNNFQISAILWASFAAGAVLMATSVAFKGAIFASLGLRCTKLSRTIFCSGVADDVMSIVFFTILTTLYSAFKTGLSINNISGIAVIVLANFLLIIFTFTLGEYWARLFLVLLGRYRWARYTIPIINFLFFVLLGKKFGISIVSSAFFAGLMMSPHDVVNYLDEVRYKPFLSQLKWIRYGAIVIAEECDDEEEYHEALNRMGIHLIDQWIAPLFFIVTGLMVPV